MQITLLRPEHVDWLVPRLHGFIDGVAARLRGCYTAHHIFDLARRGDWQFWIASEGGDILAVCGTAAVHH
jgi:hypothetical protein